MPLPPDTDTTRPRTAAARIAVLLASLALAACHPGDPLESIRQRQANGEYEGTIEPLQELIAKQPDVAEVNYLYGRALIATARNSLATFALRRAMADPAWTVPAGLELAYSSLVTADYNVVVEVATQVLEREPDNVPALLARANAQAQWRKDPEAALADANRLLELDPDAIDAMKPRILALLWLNRIDDARAALDDLGRRLDEADPPESTRAWHCATKAIFAEESNELDRAREHWAQCLRDYPATAQSVWPAVRFFDDHGDRMQSIAVLRAALASAPTDPSYRAALADRLRLVGAIGEGEELLRDSTRTEDQLRAASAWLDLARYRLAAKEPEASADAFERALDLAKETGTSAPQLPFEYADALVLAKRYDRALQIADGLSVPAQRHLIRARVAQERSDPAAALKEFDEGLRLWPDNPWARYYAARAAEDLGDFDRAVEEYRSSIRIDPGATNARTRAAQLLIAEGKPRFARALLGELKHAALETEGHMVGLWMTGRYNDLEQIDVALARFGERQPSEVGNGLAAAARGMVDGEKGAAAAVKMIRGARGVDLKEPGNAAALRALVRYSHESGARATPPELQAALAAHPDSGAFQQIRGLDLELSGADPEAARAAYARAFELEPDNAAALLSMGRITADRDPAQAVALFDRATAADPADPEPKLRAARALLAAGKREEAVQRLDALLGDHPFEAEAASLRASLDLESDAVTPRTLERARRAVRFGGGADALDLLARVHQQRGESEQAEQVAAHARALREKASDQRVPEARPPSPKR